MAHASKSALQLTALAFALASIGAHADTFTWAADTSGLWTLPISWTPLGPPTNGADVIITVTGMKTITHDLGNDSIQTLNFDAAAADPNAVLLVNSGSSLTVTSGGTNGGVIRADNGTMNFNGGTLVNNGTLNAINNGTVNFSATTLQGGTLSTASGGAIQFSGGSVLDGSSHGAIVNTGTVNLLNNQDNYALGTIANSGAISIGTNSYLHLQGTNNLTLTGAGTVSMTANNSLIFADNNQDVLTNSAGHTIQGLGNIGNNSMLLVNQGVITANVNGQQLVIDPTDGANGAVNAGTLRAENGGQLLLLNGTFNNQGGTIAALDGSAVRTQGATVQGGTLTTTGSGTVTLTGGSFLDGTAAHGAVTNTGALIFGVNQDSYAAGTINNQATMTIAGNSALHLQGANNLTLTGPGTLSLAATNSYVYGDNNTDLLTNTAGHTIQGFGNIANNSMLLANQGLITANVNGQTLTIDPTDGAGGVVNTGTLRAENGGTLYLLNGTFVNQGATTTAATGSTVLLQNALFQGGTLSTVGTGTVNLQNSSELDGNTHGAVTNNGTIQLLANQDNYAQGSLINNGSIVIGTNSELHIRGTNTLTLNGPGTLSLTAGNSIVAGDNNGDLLTNTANHTIQGFGNIGNNSMLLANQGLITANVSGQTLTIDPTDGANGVVNTGVLRAENGGTLYLLNGTFVNQGAITTAATGSTVLLQNALFQGGTLSTTGTGTVNLQNGSQLDGSTYGAITNNGTIQSLANQDSYAQGSLINNGSIVVGTNSFLHLQGTNNLTLSGPGMVSLTASNSIILGDNNQDLLTNAAGHTIQGQGNVGDNTMLLANQGLIVANAGVGITIDPTDGANGVVNTGSLRADGATLTLLNGTFNNQGGLIDARNGSTVLLSGATVQGGTLTSSQGGIVQVTGNSQLDGATKGALTSTAAIQLLANQDNYAQGVINDNGTITVGTNSYLHVLGTNNLALNGTGTTTLTATNSTILGDNNGNVLTNGAGHTIDGFGRLGNNTLQVTNAGTINANVSGQTLNLNTTSATVNQSTGVLAASNSGTLYIDKAVTGTGTIRTDSGGTVILNQAAQTGQLINNANLSLGTNNVTVSSDYNNANFGVGNSFDKRTNVSGTGQILASGDVAQAITGTTVTGGTSAAPTLTIGNVRVGGTTYNYQVANTGTSGPSIRGAIQTSVNGGNIDDNRLSGSGVTASNYGPVATGANSGNLGVTFTAASAGTLAPLSNQAVHIANNFDNLSEQTLNIVLASGAAAYNTAVGSTTPNPIVVANQRVFGNGSTALTVANTAAAGNFSEALDATFAGSTGAATTNGGSVNNIAAGAANTGALAVGVNANSSGAKTGTVTIGYQTDGTGSNGHSGLSAIGAGSQTINVSGNVYDVAVGSTAPSPIVFGNQRVGGGATQALTVSNTATAGNFSEALNASISATGSATGTGSITNIAAGSSNTGALTVGLATGTAGAQTGTVTVAYQTDGTGSNGHSGLAAIAAGSQLINVSGNVYNVAVGATTPSPVTIANQRIGGTASQNLTVSNTAAAGNFSEALNASLGAASGTATSNGGSVTNIAAGANNASALAVGVNTSSAGAKTGSVTVTYQTDGTGSNGHSGLAAIGAGSQVLNVSGNVYQAAAGAITSAPYNFGVVQVGDSVSKIITVQNTASGAAGYVEDLNASFGTATGTGANKLFGTGSVSGLVAGATSNGLTVGVNTSSAGTVNASIAVNYFSAGAVNGVSNGLGTLAVGSSGYGVSGTIQGTATVVDRADPVINNSPIALGNVRIGSTSPTGLVSVTNVASGNQQAALNASISGNAPVTSSGSFNGLAPGATNNSSLAVGIDTSSAGSKNGTATIAFVSDSSNQGCTSNCQVTLASQDVAVTGAVYRLANPTVAGSPITVAARVGTAGPTTAIGVTNTSPDIYTEGLSVTRGATSAGFTSSGSITNLVAGGSSNAIGVTLNTSTAGTFSGTQALSYVSTGAGSDGAADMSVGSGSVTLNGKVYTTAVAQSNAPSPIDFGIVHVGDTATKGVSVTNGAQVTALNDVLVASAAGATGAFTASGSLGAGLAAQQTSTNGLKVGLDTTTAGNYSGSATFSAASHDNDLTDAALANLAVSLVGQVNNYASDTFSKTSGGGMLSQSGSTFVLDYGTVTQGSGTITSSLVANNSATGPADALAGSFQFMDAADFGESGFGSFSNLMAGMSDGPLSFSFSSATLGTFMDTIVLHGVGSNASGYAGGIGDITLIVRGTVNAMTTPPGGDVPEPDSLLLLGLGLPLLFLRRGRKQRMH